MFCLDTLRKLKKNTSLSDVITTNNRSQRFVKQGSPVIVEFRTADQKEEKRVRQQIYLFFLITEKKMII